jgi:hypothetical protein
MWKSFLVLFLADITIGIVLIMPLKYFNLFPELKQIEYTTYTALKIILLLPLLEELIFRLPLMISRINLAITFSLVSLVLLNNWGFNNLLLNLILALSFFVVSLYLIKKNKLIVKLNGILKNHFWKIFYTQALIFGFLHLTNFNIEVKYFYLFPLFAFSYFISGCIFGYLRVRYKNGIFLCITSHILINGIYYLILIPSH